MSHILDAVSDSFISFANALRGQHNVPGQYVRFNLSMNREYLDTIYTSSWLSSKIVDCIAEDMTKDGINISGLETHQLNELDKYMTRLGVWGALTKLIKWSRLYGGSLGHIVISGQAQDTPLDLTTIARGQFAGIVIYDRYRAYPDTSELDLNEMPIYYFVGTQNTRVHRSRLIKFVGVELPYHEMLNNQYWGDSVLTRVLRSIELRDEALSSAGRLIGTSFLRTVKVDKLRHVIASGGQAYKNLVKTFKLLRDIQHSSGLTVLDKDDDFQTSTYSFSGLDSILGTFALEVAGACDIPLTRLYGQSPAGFSTGDSDLKSYYDKITTTQENMLREPLTKIISICYHSLYGAAPQGDVIDFEFNSPWRPSEIEDRVQTTAECNLIITAANSGLMSVPSAMQNLKDLGAPFGIFTSITDDEIAGAQEPAPAPPLAPEVEKALDDLAKGLSGAQSGESGNGAL